MHKKSNSTLVTENILGKFTKSVQFSQKPSQTAGFFHVFLEEIKNISQKSKIFHKNIYD